MLVGSAGTGAVRSESSHWTERAQALLAPLLARRRPRGRRHAHRARRGWTAGRHCRPSRPSPARRWDAGIARDLLDGIVTTDERELSGIWSTASGALGGFRSEQALAATCEPDFDVAAFVASGDTVYIAAPAHHQALVAPLVVGLLDDVRRATYARAADGDHRDRPPVLLALDELANIAPLPDLPSDGQ